jgi:uncharacterized protein (TIGR03435 family)
MKLMFVTVALCCVVSIPGSSQVAFDVVSLKPDIQTTGLVTVGCHGSDGTLPASRSIGMGMCIASRATAAMLLEFAYNLSQSMTIIPVKGTISGQPDWFDKDRFALQAKTENPPTLNELRTMLQAVLANQFKLHGRLETRQVDGYVLTIAKGGPKLEPEETVEQRGRSTSSLQRASGNVTLPTTFGISFRGAAGGAPIITGRSLNLRNVTMDEVAKSLAGDLEKPVVNETGLEGKYNLLTERFSTANEVDSQAPSLTTVIEAVGLKLQSQKVSISAFVIEHVEKPDLN